MTDKEYDFWAKIVEHLAWPGFGLILLACYGDALKDLLKKIKKLEVGSVKFDTEAESALQEAKKIEVDPKALEEVVAIQPVADPQMEIPEVPLPDPVDLGSSTGNSSSKPRGLKTGPTRPLGPNEHHIVDFDIARMMRLALAKSITSANKNQGDDQPRPSSQIIESWRTVELAVGFLLSKIDREPASSFNENLKTLEMFGYRWIDMNTIRTIVKLNGLRNKVVNTPDFEPSQEAVENFKESAAIAITALFQGAAMAVADRDIAQGSKAENG